MSVAYWLVLLAAGFAGGLSGSIAGLASLFTYPALLGAGLAPVTANVTNTIALVFNSVGSVAGSRPELAGLRRRAERLSVTGLAGGAVGGAALLLGPAGLFEKLVPVLIAGGALAILVRPRPTGPADGREHVDSRPALAGVFLIGVYGGYFGAAAGVLLLALLLATSPEPLARCNALKNLVLGLANLVAAIVFLAFGSVSLTAALPLAIGLFVGGRLGPVVVRNAPDRALRILIAVAGLGLAGYLAATTY